MYYLILMIIVIIGLYCLFMGCIVENFTWANPCRSKCHQDLATSKYKCSPHDSVDLRVCVQNSHTTHKKCMGKCL